MNLLEPAMIMCGRAYQRVRTYTLYDGTEKKNGCHTFQLQLKSLLIYSDKFKYTHL